MKEEKETKITPLFKKTLITLGIFSALEILSLGGFFLYDYLRPQIHSKEVHAYTINDLQEDISSKEEIPLKQLDILPSDYNTTSDVLGTFSHHELTEYLLYSQTLKSTEYTTLKDAYTFLQENNLNIYIPQEQVDMYFLNKIVNIAEDINKNTEEETLKYNTINTITQELINCINTNTTSFFSEETNPCSEYVANISNKDIPVTLEILLEDLILTSDKKSEDLEYNRYLKNEKLAYQLYTIGYISKEDIQDGEGTYKNIYIETNTTHLQKIKTILSYITMIMEEENIKDKNISKSLVDLKTFWNTLSEYEYGDDIPSEIYTIMNSEVSEIPDTSNIDLNEENISILVQTISLSDQPVTFFSPMYIFNNDESPVEALSFEVNDDNFNDPYDVTPAPQSKGSTRIPIFMYHQIVAPPSGSSSFVTGLYVSPEQFEAQLAYLVKHNYKTITPEELYNLLKEGGNPSQKTVMLTFDDGVSNHYTTAYPLLKKYGLVGVFYVKSRTSALNGTQMREMSDNGMIIDSHSATHPDLKKLNDPDQLYSEIVGSKYSLSATTGKPVNSIAYPGCVADSESYGYVASAGYLIGVSCGSTIDNYFSSRLSLSRVHAFGDMDSFVGLLSGVH